jgi:hypothetical protein
LQNGRSEARIAFQEEPKLLRWFTAGLMVLSVAGGFLIVMALVVPPTPRSLQMTGYSGHLAEWSLTATLKKDESSDDFSGPLTMEHTGLCSLDGPEKKAGEMRLRLARFTSRIHAKVRIDGVECEYSGSMSDVYTGLMECPGRKPVPVAFWIN